ncbi:MAG: nucleoside recognition domain-containing protein [Paraclostridium sp.]
MSTKSQTVNKTPIIEVFLGGCKKGFYAGVELILPAMILGYVIVQFLQLTGLMDYLSVIFAPIMSIFGLPGEAIVVLISAFFAKASGCATAAMLLAEGTLSVGQATILYPACILMGTLVGHYVRIILVSNTNKKWHRLLLCIPIIDAMFAMLLTRLILTIMGISI